MVSKENSSKNKKHLGYRAKRTYITVYDDVVALAQARPGEEPWLFVLLALWASSIFIARIGPALNTRTDWIIVLYTLGVSLLIVHYLLFFISVTTASLRQMRNTVPTITARLLITVAQPHRPPATGLTARDIGHLRTIAQAEQGAADWRGSFISVVALGFISVVVALTPFFLQIFGGAFPVRPGSVSENVLGLIGADNSALRNIGGVFFFLLIGVTVVRLYVFVWNFYAREAGNRTVLMACEEALGLLEFLEPMDQEEYSVEQKFQFAELLGCGLYQGDRKEALRRGSFFSRVDPDGLAWHIIPARGYSRTVDCRIWLMSKVSWIGGIGVRGYAFVRRGVAGALLWLVEMRRRNRERKIRDVEDDGFGDPGDGVDGIERDDEGDRGDGADGS